MDIIHLRVEIRVMVFNATFNNISVLSWRSVLMVKETRIPRENHQPAAVPQIIDKLYHIMLYRVHPTWAEFQLTTIVVLGTDCTGSYKSNYHTITTMTAPIIHLIAVVDNTMFWYFSDQDIYKICIHKDNIDRLLDDLSLSSEEGEGCSVVAEVVRIFIYVARGSKMEGASKYYLIFSSSKIN